jgi:hypothetical protein
VPESGVDQRETGIDARDGGPDAREHGDPDAREHQREEDRREREEREREERERERQREEDQREALNAGGEDRGPAEGEPVERELIGRKVIDPHGHTVGTIEALLFHGDTERANWARLKLDLIGIRSALIPLKDAQDVDGDVRIVYEKEWVSGAPEVEPENDRISDDDADALHSHYGLDRVQGLTTVDDEIELPRETRDAKPPAMNEGALPKPPIPGIPEDEQPSPIKKEADREGSGAQEPEQAGHD